MKNTLLFFSLFAILGSCAVNAPYFSEEMERLSVSHQKIAILPFKVSFNEEYKTNARIRGGRSGGSYWDEQERLAGLDMQKEFFVYLAKEVEKGRMEKVVQDFITTNKGLAAAAVRIQDIPSMNKGQLGRILDVDAVIWGETYIEINPFFMGSSSAGGATTVAGIYDARQGNLLWQKKMTQRPSNRMDTPKRLGGNTAQQLAKLLPYRK